MAGQKKKWLVDIKIWMVGWIKNSWMVEWVEKIFEKNRWMVGRKDRKKQNDGWMDIKMDGYKNGWI